MIIGALADIHGNFDAMRTAMERHPEVPFWLCVGEEVEACKRMRGIDVFMTHEAARPFVIVDEPKPGKKPLRRDAGKPAVNDVLASMQPRLHLCGHHHRFVETVREGVRSVCIDRVNRSYLLIDADTLEYQKIDQ